MSCNDSGLDWYFEDESLRAASSLLDCGLKLPYVIKLHGRDFVAFFDKTEMARGTLSQCMDACEHHAFEECDE